jgi:hypothetical protein
MATNDARLAIFGADSFMLMERFATRRDHSIQRGGQGCRRPADRSGRIENIPDNLATAADQPLVGGDQRHIGTDENPTVPAHHLRVEMQMIGGAAGAAAVIPHGADHLALADVTAADHAGTVQSVRVHVQVAEADMLARRLDDEIERLVARRPHQNTVAHRDHLVLVGLAAVGAFAA